MIAFLKRVLCLLILSDQVAALDKTDENNLCLSQIAEVVLVDEVETIKAIETMTVHVTVETVRRPQTAQRSTGLNTATSNLHLTADGVALLNILFRCFNNDLDCKDLLV